ncbi:hypothetical protein QUF56_10090 [Ureibacillus composti]|nr:hypothetical protein [Ureibacillus composti]
MRSAIAFSLILLMILTGCNDDDKVKVQVQEEHSPTPTVSDETDHEASEDSTDQSNDESTNNTIDFSSFFKPNQSVAYFLGEGNEFATLNVKTVWLSEKYVAHIEDNGGVTLLRVFRILDDKIEIILEEVIEGTSGEIPYPEVSALEDMQAIETYLAGPIEVGTQFGKWKIVKVDETLKTPYKNFEHVFVIEEKGDNFINRKYFVKDYGEIKRESIMQIDQEEDYIVTSTLEKISQQ